MVRRTRKFRMIQKALHPTDDVNSLYVLRKGWKELANIQDSVDASIKRLKDYGKHGETLITATRNNTDNTSINRTEKNRKQTWEEKQLYRYFKRQTSDISHEKTWTWLRKGNLKREAESLIAAQNNTIRTNNYPEKIDKTQQKQQM